MSRKVCFCGAVLAALSRPASADPVKIIAAENFYGDLASQIGGSNVAVTSILSNPDQDPHLFEATPKIAKALRDAKIVILNGVDYDPWMDTLLKATIAPGRKEIVVGALVGRKPGDNPHLWYDPASMKATAGALAADLIAIDPAHTADYREGEAKFLASLKPFEDKIAAMRKSYAGEPVTASEPVFGYQAELLGLKVQNEKLALAVMNNAEPSASEVAAFENDLKGHKVKVMIYNGQASEPAVQRLIQVAKANGVPVVAVSETEPPNSTYQTWMTGQLEALDRALAPTQ